MKKKQTIVMQSVEINLLPRAIITINGVTIFHGFKITTNQN